MKLNEFTGNQKPDFDLVRITKAKDTVDLAPNTIRAYARQGLRLFRCGKALFFSKAELADFIHRHEVKKGVAA